ncbi:MerR family transcriptional regulator [Pseudomonas aegrilactucae]|uniref:MerR family transcriptional regulator n=1 Tax=Pseudomonas aegrilactucae TaxID=2854028 RepID=A0A9Q3AD76_9PSED|nr:MerR family transcriptional regulator [Pseudomonas aegrilactucae]MBV6288362.1 MerR family transcriptional regulator [Pseudomonas aegrilactucae]
MIEPASAATNPDALVHEELFPIREVARLTGINPVTLRAWERRYGLIQPTRTESGHRLYSRSDIDDVRAILGWIERGVAVSKVGKILVRNHTLKAQASVEQACGQADCQQWQVQVRQAVKRFDEGRLEQVYGQVFATYPLVMVFQDIFMPVWHELRTCSDAFGAQSEWLLLDGFLRARALQRLQLSREQQDVSVVLAAIPGHCRELELLVAGLLLGCSEIAIRVLALGQPMEELSLVCERIAPHALVLFSNHSPAADLPKRLARLANAVECPVLFAGEAAELAQDGLMGSQVACLGSEARLMRRRLQQYLAGHLDT